MKSLSLSFCYHNILLMGKGQAMSDDTTQHKKKVNFLLSGDESEVFFFKIALPRSFPQHHWTCVGYGLLYTWSKYGFWLPSDLVNHWFICCSGVVMTSVIWSWTSHPPEVVESKACLHWFASFRPFQPFCNHFIYNVYTC